MELPTFGTWFVYYDNGRQRRKQNPPSHPTAHNDVETTHGAQQTLGNVFRCCNDVHRSCQFRERSGRFPESCQWTASSPSSSFPCRASFRISPGSPPRHSALQTIRFDSYRSHNTFPNLQPAPSDSPATAAGTRTLLNRFPAP